MELLTVSARDFAISDCHCSSTTQLAPSYTTFTPYSSLDHDQHAALGSLLQPLQVDVSMDYALDLSLFVGDARQPVLVFPWQVQDTSAIKTDDDKITSCYSEELSWEQVELSEMIGKTFVFKNYILTITYLMYLCYRCN